VIRAHLSFLSNARSDKLEGITASRGQTYPHYGISHIKSAIRRCLEPRHNAGRRSSRLPYAPAARQVIIDVPTRQCGVPPGAERGPIYKEPWRRAGAALRGDWSRLVTRLAGVLVSSLRWLKETRPSTTTARSSLADGRQWAGKSER